MVPARNIAQSGAGTQVVCIVHSEAGSPVSVHTDDSTVTYFKITGVAQNCPPNFILQ